MASITPINGRATFITAQDPHTYWELNTTNLGTGFGRDTSGNQTNSAVASGDISTADSYEGMDNQNDPPQNGWLDTCIVTDAAALLYIPADLTHLTTYGIFHNGGGTNSQGAWLRATPTGVEIATSHHKGSSGIDAVVYEIPDADLPGWFAVSWQYNSHGGSEGDMALWVNGTAVASATRTFPLDYGSGNPDFGDNAGREPTTGTIRDGPTANGNWTGNNSINGSGILIANFAADNPAMAGSAPGDSSPGAGDTFHTDYFDTHTDSATTVSVSALRLGDTSITALYLGDTSISKAYLGDTLVFGGGGATPDTFTSTFQENF